MFYTLFILLCGLYLGQEYDLPKIRTVCESLVDYMRLRYVESNQNLKYFGKFW